VLPMARSKQNKSQNDKSNYNQFNNNNNNEDMDCSSETECDKDMTNCSQVNDNNRTNELNSQKVNVSKQTINDTKNNSEINDKSMNDSTVGNEDKINVCFIELKPNNSIGRQPKSMQNAFSSMKSHKFDPKWIKANEVMTIQSFNNYLFIIDSFDGQVFDFLVEKNARIIGPLTVLYCYSSECKTRYQTIPIKSCPIFSQCMRKLNVSITNFEGRRKNDLINKIERMCGTFSKDFTKRVTHLVSDSVRTNKYKVASSIGVTVVSSEWVDFCWEKYQHLLCHASDQQIIQKYRLPMFNKLMITVSQVFLLHFVYLKTL